MRLVSPFQSHTAHSRWHIPLIGTVASVVKGGWCAGFGARCVLWWDRVGRLPLGLGVKGSHVTQFRLARHIRSSGPRHSRRRLPLLKLGALAAVVVALAAILFFVPSRSHDSATTQAPPSTTLFSPQVERTSGTTRSGKRPSLPVGKPLLPVTTPWFPSTRPTPTPSAPAPPWSGPLSGPSRSSTPVPPTTLAKTTPSKPTSTTPAPAKPATTTASPTTPSPAAPSSTTPTPTTPSPTSPSPATPSSTTPSSTTPTAVVYKDCAEVRAAGKAPLYRGDPGYSTALDHNGDGVACENGSS